MSSHDDDAEHVAKLSAFFETGKRHMTATYKPVLLRCLLDIGRHNNGSATLPAGGTWIRNDGENVIVNLNFIAARFAKYYWDMSVSFDGLKQSHHHDGSTINTIIMKYGAARVDPNPPTIADLETLQYEDLRQEVIELMKKDALPRLRDNTHGLYRTSTVDPDEIVLKSSIVPFFRRYRVIIQNALNHKLASHLEVCNKELPKIATTIEDMPAVVPRRVRWGNGQA